MSQEDINNKEIEISFDDDIDLTYSRMIGQVLDTFQIEHQDQQRIIKYMNEIYKSEYVNESFVYIIQLKDFYKIIKKFI